MTLAWMPWNAFLNNYLLSETKKKQSVIKNIVKSLHMKYPSPEDWLSAPNDERVTFKKYGYSDLHYIICWFWDKKLYTDPNLIPVLLEYVLSKEHASSRAPIWLASKLSLLSEEEMIATSDAYKSLCKRLAIHCIFLGKAFNEFVDEDIYKLPSLFQHSMYTATALQNIRINLKYTDSIVKRQRETNWNKLQNSSQFSSIYKSFHQYLIRCDVRKKYLLTMATYLKKFDLYLQNQSLDNCSSFDAQSFEKFTEHLRNTLEDASVLDCIAKLKRFFEWGVGTDTFFPDQLDYPIDYWQQLTRRVKKNRKSKEGRAFSESDLAEQIVNVVYNYIPQNEIDELCRNFWLILSSCPARFSYVLNLEAHHVLQSLPNEPNAFGIYSKLADKAGNKYGQFPILDNIGLEAIKSLQARANALNLMPIVNPYNGEKYTHLFQMTKSPWILDPNMIRIFFEEKVKKELEKTYHNFESLQITAHGFRHHLLTHVAYITGDITVVQTAAGHHTEKMTREYLKSKVSRNALLFRVMKKYDSQEITGKFYLRLIELLSSEETPVDDMLRALTTEMKLDEFINRYGKKLAMGYCFNEGGCSNWLKCWSCTNFLMTKEEISYAIKTLAHQIINLKEMQKNSMDFCYDHPIVQKQTKVISLIVKRLTELALTEDQISLMVDNYLHGRLLEEGVIYNVS